MLHFVIALETMYNFLRSKRSDQNKSDLVWDWILHTQQSNNKQDVGLDKPFIVQFQMYQRYF